MIEYGYLGLCLCALILIFFASSPMSSRRAAGLLLAAAIAQPVVVTVLSGRTSANVGAVAVVSPTGKLVGMALNVAILTIGLALVMTRGRSLDGPARWMVAGVWGMAAALFLAGLMNGGATDARYQGLFALTLTAILLHAPDRVTTVSWFRAAIRLLLFASIVSAVVAPGWAFIGAGSNGEFDRTLFGFPRLMGFTPHPNDLSMVAAVGVLLELVGPGRRGVRGAALLPAVACLILAQSNTGYAAVLVGTLVLLFRGSLFRRLMIVGAATFIGLAAIGSLTRFLPATMQQSSYLESVSGRTEIWKLSLEEWHRHPIIGYGPTMYSKQYLSSNFPADMSQATNGHNQVIQTLADSGLLGAIALSLLLLGAIACARRAAKTDGNLSAALLLVLIVFGLTETPLRVSGVATVAALAVLCIAAVSSVSVATDLQQSTSEAGRNPASKGRADAELHDGEARHVA